MGRAFRQAGRPEEVEQSIQAGKDRAGRQSGNRESRAGRL
jgi:hypothetical protein